MDVHHVDAITAMVRVDHLARVDQLAARRRLDRTELLGKAIDVLLAQHDLAGGYLGPERGRSTDSAATVEITAEVRSDHLRRLDTLAERRGRSRSELIGQAIDGFLAQEALIGAFGAAESAAWFAPAPNASIWAALRSGASSGRRWGTRKRHGSRRRPGPGSPAT